MQLILHLIFITEALLSLPRFKPNSSSFGHSMSQIITCFVIYLLIVHLDSGAGCERSLDNLLVWNKFFWVRLADKCNEKQHCLAFYDVVNICSLNRIFQNSFETNPKLIHAAVQGYLLGKCTNIERKHSKQIDERRELEKLKR